MNASARKVLFASAAATALAFSGTADAAADLNAGLQAMQELNVIVFDNMTSYHDVEGKVFVGGDLLGNTQFGIGNGSQGATTSTRPTLTVVGNANGDFKIDNGSNGGSGPAATVPGFTVGGDAGRFTLNTPNATALVGGNLNGFNGSNGSTVSVGGTASGVNANGTAVNANLGADFTFALQSDLQGERDSLIANLTGLSQTLAGFATTAGSGFDFGDYNNVKLNAVAGDAGFAVVNIDAADLGLIRGLSYDFALGTPTIVNVTGELGSNWSFNPLGNNKAFNQDVIFNFVDATALDFGTIVNGSVLAPFAAVTNHTPIEGTLVARSFTQNGEVHLGTFGGGIEFNDTVPEPATWAMLIAGFGLVGLAARRRRTAATA